MTTTLESAGLWLAQQKLRSRLDARAWHRCADRFAADLGAMDGLDLAPWVTPLWEAFNARMRSALLPVPPKRFLRESVIRQSMFVDVRGAWLEAQLALLREVFGEERLADLAAETPVGDPPLCDAGLMTSHNTVHHLAHLASYERRVGLDPTGSRRVVEWGGGYGNLCRLMHVASEGLERYVVVDTPLFCALQRVYLSMTLGEARVRLWNGEDEFPGSGVVLVPVPLVDRMPDGADLFISTWALSECPSRAQDYVSGTRGWFGADRLLLAFQASNEQLPEAGRIDSIARAAGCDVEPVGVIEDNFYAFS